MPSMAPRPGDHDQPVQHDREDRPPHEQRREALGAAADVRPARHRAQPAASGARRDRRLVALEGERRAGPQHLHAFGHHPRPRRQVAVDENRVVVALHDPDRHPLGPALDPDPDVGALAAPLDRERVDRGEGVAGKAQRDREGHPGPQPVAGVVEARAHPKRPGVGVDPAVHRRHLAVERRCRDSDSGCAAAGIPTLTLPTKRSGMRKSTRISRAVVERRHLGIGRRPGRRARPRGCRRSRRTAPR